MNESGTRSGPNDGDSSGGEPKKLGVGAQGKSRSESETGGNGSWCGGTTPIER